MTDPPVLSVCVDPACEVNSWAPFPSPALLEHLACHPDLDQRVYESLYDSGLAVLRCGRRVPEDLDALGYALVRLVCEKWLPADATDRLHALMKTLEGQWPHPLSTLFTSPVTPARTAEALFTLLQPLDVAGENDRWLALDASLSAWSVSTFTSTIHEVGRRRLVPVALLGELAWMPQRFTGRGPLDYDYTSDLARLNAMTLAQRIILVEWVPTWSGTAAELMASVEDLVASPFS